MGGLYLGVMSPESAAEWVMAVDVKVIVAGVKGQSLIYEVVKVK